MLFRYLAALVSLALVLAACGPTGPERKRCEDGCAATYDCPPGEPNPACEAALIECQDNCAAETVGAHDSPENVSHAASALTVSPSAFYAIAYASGYGPSTGTYCNDPNQSTWCECNVDYTDAAPRCNEPTATVFWHFPAPACVVSSATLTYQATEGAAGRTVSIRRILRPVTTPPMGLAGSCVTSSVASWWRSGPDAWTTPGAKGDGTDRTATGPSRTLTVTAPHSESFDVTSLVQGCPASGDCVLAQYADAHVSVQPGAVLDVVCGTPAICGDGVKAGSETCDDANTTAGDGCSALCAIETGWSCSGAPSACAPICGDGLVKGTEACDDGNASNTDACLNTCQVATCGDGFVRAGVEQCDDANQINTDACLNTCVTASCGDGFLRAGIEQCDDGNASNVDACVAGCVSASCGDGFVWAGAEECDLGASNGPAATCSTACVSQVCSCQ